MFDDHKHQIDWVTEGPLWFCKCGAEFFPGVKTATVPEVRPRRSLRIRLEKHA